MNSEKNTHAKNVNSAHTSSICKMSARPFSIIPDTVMPLFHSGSEQWEISDGVVPLLHHISYIICFINVFISHLLFRIDELKDKQGTKMLNLS